MDGITDRAKIVTDGVVIADNSDEISDKNDNGQYTGADNDSNQILTLLSSIFSDFYNILALYLAFYRDCD